MTATYNIKKINTNINMTPNTHVHTCNDTNNICSNSTPYMMVQHIHSDRVVMVRVVVDIVMRVDMAVIVVGVMLVVVTVSVGVHIMLLLRLVIKSECI